MPALRVLTPSEISTLTAAGCTAQQWSQVEVSLDFSPSQLVASRFEGRVRIASGVHVISSTVRNYSIGERTLIEGVTALECRQRSRFGNGVGVATMNECAGRTVRICDQLSAQSAYLMAIYRHRPQLIAALDAMIESYAESRASELGQVGDDCRLIGARFIREVRLGNRVTVDGASILENGTLCDDSRIGVDVKAYNFIAAEGAYIGNGTVVDHCFVGESSILDKGFTAEESLFFANAYCENGEAASIFAGPYTVSHHKSSLLIAGMFSFFNAGSGANQSNHLFKSGAVHQSVHLRGCKFASSAYIMSPALEGAFTMVLGSHSFHHDTSALPFSYLIEKDGRSVLMPGANLISYGTVRDLAKWPQRDKRSVQRDLINFEEHNPYLTGAMIQAVNTLHTLQESDPDAAFYTYKKVIIKAAALHRGIGLYNKAIVSALGAMLTQGNCSAHHNGGGQWLDIAGQFITKAQVDTILTQIEQGELATLPAVDNAFRLFALHYPDYAHSWAENILGNLLGQQPSEQQIADAITSGTRARTALSHLAQADRARDCSLDMAVSYGLDSQGDEQEIHNDYNAVRGLQ